MFKDKFKELRKNNNYTQDDLAAKLNISRQSISKWENGLSYPTRSMLNRICEVYEIQVQELLNEEEILFISIDNNTSVKSIKRRTILIASSVLMTMIILIIFVLIFNNRINQIEQSEGTQIISDPILGFIVLDQAGTSLYDANDETTLASLIDSKLYPYQYLYLDWSNSFWDSNKMFDYLRIEDEHKINVEMTVFIQRTNGLNIHLYPILYNLNTGIKYLGTPSGYTGAGLFTVTSYFEDKSNEIVNKDTYYAITFSFVDELENVELYQYNEMHIFIDSQEIGIDASLSLDEETLYFIFRETYRDMDGNLYINKIEVSHNDFDQFFWYQYKVFDENCFAKVSSIRIDTHI